MQKGRGDKGSCGYSNSNLIQIVVSEQDRSPLLDTPIQMISSKLKVGLPVSCSHYLTCSELVWSDVRFFRTFFDYTPIAEQHSLSNNFLWKLKQ